MVYAVFFLGHFLQFFYDPANAPWYMGAVWSNVFVLIVVVPLGWLWSKSKFWPLNFLERRVKELHERHDALAKRHDEIVAKLDSLHDKHDQLMEHLKQ